MHACRSPAMRSSRSPAASLLIAAAVACSLLRSTTAQNQIGCYSTNASVASLSYINTYTYGITSVLSTSVNYTACLSTVVSGWNYLTPPGAQSAAYALSGKHERSDCGTSPGMGLLIILSQCTHRMIAHGNTSEAPAPCPLIAYLLPVYIAIAPWEAR